MSVKKNVYFFRERFFEHCKIEKKNKIIKNKYKNVDEKWKQLKGENLKKTNLVSSKSVVFKHWERFVKKKNINKTLLKFPWKEKKLQFVGNLGNVFLSKNFDFQC